MPNPNELERKEDESPVQCSCGAWILYPSEVRRRCYVCMGACPDKVEPKVTYKEGEHD